MILLVASLAAFMVGVDFRRTLFEWSAPIHHEDVWNGFRRARVIHDTGILDVYDAIARSEIDQVRHSIDYAPLRLTAFGMWAAWFESRYPSVRWNASHAHTWPMLAGNTAAEVVSSILIFMLVRLWWRRSHDPLRKTTARAAGIGRAAAGANLVGFTGAMLFWFNPAILWDAHCWPQWDVWLVPFFLGAVLLACKEWWFLAGMCLVCGAFFKGQILLVSPMLVLWPVFQRRWSAAVRCVAGAIVMTAALAFPWMTHAWFRAPSYHVGGFVWVGSTILMMCLAIALYFRTTGLRIGKFRLPALRGAGLPVVAMVAGISTLLLMPLFGASDAWITYGFRYGAHKFPMLASAPGTYSVPTLLRDVFGWSNDMDAPAPIPGIPFTISTRRLMLSLYALCLILCSAGVAIHDRRRDARFLVAVVTPWLCFFSLLTQMNNRYLVWACGLSALLIGVDLGLTLLGLVVSLICVVGMAQHMLPIDPTFAPDALRWVMPMRTHMAWPIALAAGVYLYVAVKPSRRSRHPIDDLKES